MNGAGVSVLGPRASVKNQDTDINIEISVQRHKEDCFSCWTSWSENFQIQRCYVKQSIPKQCTAHLLSARHKMLFEERLGGEERRLMHLVWRDQWNEEVKRFCTNQYKS